MQENGVTATRKTISEDIETLTEFGMDIICNRSTQNQYHVGDRVFEVPEVKLLVDAVQSARFITEKKSKSLIKKLSCFVGLSQADELKRNLYVEQRIKAENEEIYLLVDIIHRAIRKELRVTFQYYEYTPEKEKVRKHGGKQYVFSPYALVWNDDCYYAFGHSDAHGKIVKFRVDRMCGLELTDTASAARPEDFAVSEYFSRVFSMYEGRESMVELLCENSTMKYIIERFGETVDTEITDREHFKVRTTVSLSSTFFGWIFSFGGKIRLTAPEEAVKEFQENLRVFI